MTDGRREREEGLPDWLDEAVRELRRPVPRPPGVVDRVVRAAVEDERGRGGAAGARRRGGWWSGRRLVLSPLTAGAWALATAALLVLALRGGQAPTGPGGRQAPEEAVVVHRFVVEAPGARSVAVVGDFNGWELGATPLVRRGDVWQVEVPLVEGHHVYSFVVDGTEWIPDESAPRAPDDGFGRPSSVLFVPGSTL